MTIFFHCYCCFLSLFRATSSCHSEHCIRCTLKLMTAIDLHWKIHLLNENNLLHLYYNCWEREGDGDRDGKKSFALDEKNK